MKMRPQVTTLTTAPRNPVVFNNCEILMWRGNYAKTKLKIHQKPNTNTSYLQTRPQGKTQQKMRCREHLIASSCTKRHPFQYSSLSDVNTTCKKSGCVSGTIHYCWYFMLFAILQVDIHTVTIQYIQYIGNKICTHTRKQSSLTKWPVNACVNGVRLLRQTTNR